MTDLFTLLSTDPLTTDPTLLIPSASDFIQSPVIPDHCTSTHLLHLLSLVDLIHPLPSHSRYTLLTVIKLLATHSHLNSPLYLSLNFRILAIIAGFIPHPNNSISLLEPNDIAANEARKIIANLILLNRNDGIHIFINENCLAKLLDLSKSHITTLDTIFIVYRILFLLTSSPEHIQSVIDVGVDHYNSLIIRVLQSADSPPPFTRTAVLSEILKTMFNLLSFLDTLPIKPNNLFSSTVLHTITQIFTLFPILNPPMSSPLSHAIHVLMCGPNYDWCTIDLITILCTKILLPELDTYVFPPYLIKGKPYNNKLTMEAAHKSSDSINNINTNLSPGDRLPPLLHLLAKVYESETKQSSSSLIASTIKNYLVPNDLDRKTPIDEGRTLGHFVIRLLTYAESANLREAAEVMIYNLCDQDPRKMVAHTGLGPSAGFLVNHGLLREDIFENQNQNPSLNPITGQTEDEDEVAKAKEDWKKMTDEEKEQEAERLFVLFERMNKLGVIKAIDPTTGKEINSNHNVSN